MKLVILAAGVGSRLGKPFPKALSVLPNQETILGRQIRIFKQFGIREIYVVVGFKKSLIMEKFPDVFYKYNPFYYLTNTSKSLLTGINDLIDDVIWVNGDVVFDENIVQNIINFNGNVVSVNNSACGEEEVKYRTDSNGKICEISKIVDEPEGEAVGINKICKKDLAIFKDALKTCDDNDYFERGLEIIIQKNITIRPLDISNYKCIEVDFEDDWKRALDLFF